ncbi:MAG: MaoC family dehydratase N-terminal domain-containing protein [Deltaproteobacteria bacterium]|nr:MaoC family dehydratase N-terminal domain-containing protein [Deltaproteobacteria bacterium]
MSDAPETIVSDELRRCIGRKGPVRALETLSASDVRRYVDATGDANPLWLDDDFARSAGYGGRLLPPILVGWTPFSIKEPEGKASSFDVRRQLPVPAAYTNVRNAGSETEWLQPVLLGEPLTCQSHIVDITARQGRMGAGIYVTQLEEVRNAEGGLVFARRHTVALFRERQARE